ncbi:unnamed protein product [Lathyrus oleraceus]
MERILFMAGSRLEFGLRRRHWLVMLHFNFCLAAGIVMRLDHAWFRLGMRFALELPACLACALQQLFHFTIFLLFP